MQTVGEFVLGLIAIAALAAFVLFMVVCMSAPWVGQVNRAKVTLPSFIKGVASFAVQAVVVIVLAFLGIAACGMMNKI